MVCNAFLGLVLCDYIRQGNVTYSLIHYIEHIVYNKALRIQTLQFKCNRRYYYYT